MTYDKGRSLFLIRSLMLIGCGENATKTAEKCAESDLIAQCPVGTLPDLTASATSMCDGSAEANLLNEEGAVTGSCQGTGDCRVVCRFETPCQCGVERITAEGVFCVPDCVQAACGNGQCEAGENLTNCEIDCGARCTSGQERCNGQHRDICSQSGVWEPVNCGEGSQCRETDGVTRFPAACRI